MFLKQCQAVFFPVILTALLYLGPLMTAALDGIGKQKQEQLCAQGAVELVNSAYRKLGNGIYGAVSMRSDVLAWRNYVVFLPYFYVIFLTILLFDRAHRDDQRCRAKYGKYWDMYCKKVPYRIIPGVY